MGAWSHIRNTSSHPAADRKGSKRITVSGTGQSDAHTHLKMTNNAVRLFSPHATCRRSLQVLLSSNQQVPCCWVTATMCTAVAVVRLLTHGGSSQDWRGEGGAGNESQWTGKKQHRLCMLSNISTFHNLCPQIQLRLNSVTKKIDIKTNRFLKENCVSMGGKLRAESVEK